MSHDRNYVQTLQRKALQSSVNMEALLLNLAALTLHLVDSTG